MVTHSQECAARASREIHLLDGRVVDVDRPRGILDAAAQTTAANHAATNSARS